MKIFAQDSIALDFALTAGFSNVFKGTPLSNAKVHSYNNPNQLPKYLLNYRINITSRFPTITDDTIKTFDIDFFDCYIFPWYQRKEKFIQVLKKHNKKIIFYGTEEKTDLIHKGKVKTFVDKNNIKWDYVVSPIVSYKFFYSQLISNGITPHFNFDFTSKKYYSLLNTFRTKWTKIFGKELPSVVFFTKSTIRKNAIFIYSPGFLGSIYKNIGFNFATNLSQDLKKTGDGITLSYERAKQIFGKSCLLSFAINYEPLSAKEKRKLLSIGRIIAKAKSFLISHDVVYAQHGIIGMRYFLKKLDQIFSYIYYDNKVVSVLRINNAHKAIKFYKEKLGFIEEWKYLYLDVDPKIFHNKVLRAKLWFLNVPVVIAEEIENKTRRILSIEVERNQFENDRVKEVFDILAKEGKVISPLLKNFTGDTYGEVIDKFDVYWEIKIKEEK